MQFLYGRYRYWYLAILYWSCWSKSSNCRVCLAPLPPPPAILAASSVRSLRLWVGVMAGEEEDDSCCWRICLLGVVGERRRGELVSSPKARLIGFWMELPPSVWSCG